ncbi:unnamed protein product [Cylindrotheca closterium]|uniref:RNI-like protein n=1 Tax=Cylindrotheca closterium TaxID=2856 RepID=A0AAD2G6D6_9STRA|nr:unnamed protein product [Cylindrotheca closterium]
MTDDSSSTLTVHEECLKGLKVLKDHGLLKIPGDEPSNEDDDDDDLTRRCHAWTSANPSLQFDQDGYLVLLDIGGKRLHRGFPAPMEVFAHFTRLHTINLAGTDLPLAQVMEILNRLVNQLEGVFVGGNGLRVQGGVKLGEWIPLAKRLRKLDVRYNDLEGDGMEALCCQQGGGLQENPSVQLLYAEGNQIGDKGAKAIASLLEQDSLSLQGLFLGANQIGPAGAKAFASALSQNKTLTKLYLEGNNIRLEGANAFSDALEAMNHSNGATGTGAIGSTLKHLFVDNNNIGKEGSKRLAKALNSDTAIGESLLE